MFDEIGFPRGAGLDDSASVLATFVCSRAAQGVDDGEVGRIVELAQRRNLTRGITGVLVFGSGVFFQWIEGLRVRQPVMNEWRKVEAESGSRPSGSRSRRASTSNRLGPQQSLCSTAPA